LDVEYEVSCRDADLGRHVLERVRVGDHIVVLGTLRLSAVAGPLEDSVSAARLTLLAKIVALDLVPADERVSRDRIEPQ
jgi:hypothetical protein